MLGELLADLAQRQIGAAGNQPRQIGRHRADRRRDRHVVVVEHDDQARVHRAGVVHRLVGHARRHRAVADHRDDVVRLAFEIARHRHAERGGDRRRRMRGAEGVVFALGALGETGKSAADAQRANAVAAAGQNLVRIGLMADVPDQFVFRRVEHVMQRDGKLDDAETGAEMSAGDRDRVDCFSAQLIGNLLEIGNRMSAEVARFFDIFKHQDFPIHFSEPRSGTLVVLLPEFTFTCSALTRIWALPNL